MKKLLVGLLALGSISSFAVDLNSCDVSELNIHTDNDISLKDTEDIKKKLSEKGYLFDNLGADAGLVINIGLQREHGFHSAQKYAGVNQGKTKLGTFFNIVGTNLHNLGADIKDVYNMTTVKAFRVSDVSSCIGLSNIKQVECENISGKTRSSLYELTPDSKKHDLRVIDWSIRKLPECN